MLLSVRSTTTTGSIYKSSTHGSQKFCQEKKPRVNVSQAGASDAAELTKLTGAHRRGAGAGKGHEFGVKLKTADGSRMFPVQHSHLHPVLGAPHVDPPVL